MMRLETERLVLREFVRSDVSSLHAIESDDRVTRYMSFDPQSEDETKAYIENAMRLQTETPRRFFDLAIIQKTHGALIGRCGFGLFRPEHHEAGVWYHLSPAHWGCGLATEAVRALLRPAFEDVKLHRLFADIDPRNTASRRIVRKLGFKLDGVMRENYRLKGEWCDAAIYSLLAHEWRESQGVQAAHVRAKPESGS